MPVQRKVFRIEESARLRAPRRERVAGSGEAGHPHPDTAAELASLRALIEPRGNGDREAQELARAQAAEARAFKHELGLIHAAVENSRDGLAALDADAADGRAARASRELAAIVASTERATQAILQAAEEIDHAAGTLSAALKSAHDRGLAHDIQDCVVRIFEACNFQDLTGQRVAHVVETLNLIEQRTAHLLETWRRIEAMEPTFSERRDDDSRFLNGPKLAGEGGHSSQTDIDVIFRRA